MARPEIRSHRKTKTIENIYAVVVKDDEGTEGVVRRDTPSGTQPLISDDAHLAESLLALAQVMFPHESAYIVTFARVQA